MWEFMTTAPSFTQQERLAMEYAERFAMDHLSIDDAFIQGMRESFTDAEILDLTICLSALPRTRTHPPGARHHRGRRSPTCSRAAGEARRRPPMVPLNKL